jgi:hypothetical protein
MKVDMNKYRSENSRVFSGRDRGKSVRAQLGLDEFDKNEEVAEFTFPVDILSINNSFFIGMFGLSVKNLGRVRFIQKYKFFGDEVLLENIEEGIERSLRVRSVI